MCKVVEEVNAGEMMNYINNEGYDDWYVPAYGQLDEIYTNKVEIDKALANINGTTLGSDTYWSSSEINDADAWCMEFGSGSAGRYSKKASNRY